MNKVVPLHAGRMTEAEYERERASLRKLYGDSSAEAGAKREQALAKLFYQSGWTQEELAKKEGKSPQQIARALRFGRFLDFLPVGELSENPTFNLSERKFRSFWERTDGTNERARFKQVLDLIEHSTLYPPPRPKVVHDNILKQFGDGKWHRLETIAEKLDADKEHVHETIVNMNKRNAAKSETKKVGTSTSYRIFRNAKQVSIDELAEKLTPIIEDLQQQSGRAPGTIPNRTIATLAAQLRNLLKEMAE